jgi:hypothetical protein
MTSIRRSVTWLLLVAAPALFVLVETAGRRIP